jgi:MFS family permease
VYVFYNLVYALAAYPLGVLADRIGMKRVLVGGLIIFAAVYTGMGVAESKAVFFGLFLLYGVYAAATEGVAKAWITNLCRKEDTATAIGTFTAFQSLAALAASTLTGLMWVYAGPMAAFGLTAAVSVGVAVYLGAAMGAKAEG